MDAPDRLKKLKGQNKVTGINFVYIPQDLDDKLAVIEVHFLKHPEELDVPLPGNLTKDKISIYIDNQGEDKIENPVQGELVWIPSSPELADKCILQIKTLPPKNRSLYRLNIEHELIDPYYNNIQFSYQAGCKSDLDCKTPLHECPQDESEDISIDYSSRDFWSFRRALLDFASLRYPDWKDRLEADAGIMLTEVMSALGDEMAYYQDRVAREAYLETATQQRSIRRLARLVDYIVHDGLGATTWIDVIVKDGKNADLKSGLGVWALSDKKGKIEYETGRGLDDILKGQTFHVDASRNSSKLAPHIWDEDDKCLPFGSTELYIEGHHKENLKFDYPPVPPDEGDSEPLIKPDGKWVVLQTNPKSADIPIRKWLVKLIKVEQDNEIWNPMIDPVIDNAPITRIKWDKSQATPFEMDMETLEVRANLVPVTSGKEITQYFTFEKELNFLDLPEEEKAKIKQTVEREGPNGSIIHLFSLEYTDSAGLVYLGDNERTAIPEIQLVEVKYEGGEWQEDGKPWHWRRSFLGIHSSQSNDKHFILEDGMWRRVVGYQRSGQEIIHHDYATGNGKTIRFGDGELGIIPSESSIFRVIYRIGDKTNDNVPADTITEFESDYQLNGAVSGDVIEKVNNPLPVSNGKSSENHESVKLFAPEEYKATTYRAVFDTDYAEAAERLEWVQRSGAKSRWTGSWLSTFVTPDPMGTTDLTNKQQDELFNHLDLFRQTGREVIIKNPVFADIDLKITICVSPEHFPGEVKESVLEVLLGKKGIIKKPGFFSPDNFTFGDGLKRSVLEATIQSSPGVRAVMCMKIRRRGWHGWRILDEYEYKVADNEVIRLDNDPRHPERGSLKLIMEGGA